MNKCNSNALLVYAVLALTVLQIGACSPATRFQRAAQSVDLTREDITIGNLPLVIFRDEIAPGSPRIHFYVDGDGSPWIHGKRVASDPTSRSKLILELMAADDSPKVLVGRPCYYIAVKRRPASCTESLWTSHRYSAQVVAAMRSVIEQQVARHKPKEVVLIGYSGGGTLATLIASEMEQAKVLITIAANLDVDAWIEKHSYSPLSRSLNRFNFPQLPPDVRQIHFVGGEDQNVPPWITKAVAEKQLNARVVEEGAYSHECCWPDTWASTLAKILE
ncbi:MAG: alpha/beta fold hydrolase [Gammaproteobacteria bacterium]